MSLAFRVFDPIRQCASLRDARRTRVPLRVSVPLRLRVWPLPPYPPCPRAVGYAKVKIAVINGETKKPAKNFGQATPWKCRRQGCQLLRDRRSARLSAE